MLLTILIPTRNRSHRVVPLVRSLLANLAAVEDLEILVLNNASTDDTEESLRQIENSALRVVTNERFLPTSEENVYNGIQFAIGKFVWFLGDDDVPRYDSVFALIDELRADAADLFVSNFRVTDGDGRLSTLSQIRGLPKNTTLPLASLIRRAGLINMLSGWSIMVARRSRLDSAKADRIRAVSPIYSHCFWFLSCFSAARVQLVGRPLVDYRVFHHHEGWETYTRARAVGLYHYWHLGLLRLYEDAVRQGYLTYRDISCIYEYRHDGTRYRGIDEIVTKLIEQVDVYLTTGDPRNLLLENDFEEAATAILKIDLRLQDTIAALRALYHGLWSSDFSATQVDETLTLRRKAYSLLIDRQRDLYEPFFRELLYGYVIYEVDGSWIAIRVDAMAFADSVFSQFEPQPMPPGVLVEKSRLALLAAIRRCPPTSEPVGNRPALQLSPNDDFRFREAIREAQTAARAATLMDMDVWDADPGETNAVSSLRVAQTGQSEQVSGIVLSPSSSGQNRMRNSTAHFLRSVAQIVDRRPPPRDFDQQWYSSRYPSTRTHARGAYRYYLRQGRREGHNPNPYFDSDWYLWRYPDIKKAGVDPFEHFRMYGLMEGRDPHPQHDNAAYQSWLATRS